MPKNFARIKYKISCQNFYQSLKRSENGQKLGTLDMSIDFYAFDIKKKSLIRILKMVTKRGTKFNPSVIQTISIAPLPPPLSIL